MAKPSQGMSLGAIVGGIAWPLVLGLGLTAGFFGLLFRGPLDHPLLHRYFAGHPINMVETAFLFIGLVALVNKGLDVFGQWGSLEGVSLGVSTPNQPASKASELLDSLSSLPARFRDGYLGRRLRDALEFIERRGSADGLDQELKYLADLDLGRQQDSYALVRIIVWATPMLGFLGTVVGITAAMGDLANQDMSNPGEAIKHLLSGLYVAFDTTAIALVFSMGLMFIQFGIERFEGELLGSIEQRASRELGGRFEETGAASDPQVAQVQKMSQAVLRNTEQLVQRQAELWQGTIAAAHQHWERLQQSTTQQLQNALTSALGDSLTRHARELGAVNDSAAQQLTARWEQWQVALSDSARLLLAQQQEMAKQGELMHRALQATGDVMQLEQALNANLSALAGSKNFEDTVMSLAAAIHLLNNRLGKSDAQTIEHVSLAGKNRAA